MTVDSPTRRLFIAAGLLVAALVACGREITGPAASPVSLFRRVAAFSFEPRYETALPAAGLRAALSQVAFERVRVTLRREDGSIALDTVVDFPVGADSLTLSLNVPLPASASSSGVPFSLSLRYVTAAGDTVFKGGPTAVTISPSTGTAPPPPVRVPVQYTGTGSNAAAVVLLPKTLDGIAGQSASVSAQAVSSTGQVIPGTPIVFSSSNSAVVRIPNPTDPNLLFVGRGTAKVYGQLLTGPADSVTVTVTLPASRLALASGGGQTAAAGTTLAQPVVARVLAADGIGVGGVTVAFAAANGGSVTPASAVSTADGSVSTLWKLGVTAGAQSLTVTSAGLTGSPLTVAATALAVTATKLGVVTGPVSGKAGAALPAITVAAQTADGTTVTTFGDDVTVAIGTNPGGATLGGTKTVKAVNGVATFGDLKLDRPGTGYTLSFSTANLGAVNSAAFDISAGDAATLVFGAMPAGVDAGIAIVPPLTVTAKDASGNAVTSFTGAVTLALGNNPSGATLKGTLTRNAVAGAATFNDVSLNKSGPSYTLTATAAGLTNATSTAFSVSPGAAAAIAVTTGADQQAVIGSTLAPIGVQLRDGLGNGIDGVILSFAISAGGGSLSASTVATDALGNATITWTLGASVGTQSIAVSVSGTAVSTTISATAVAGQAAKLVLATSPATTQTAGVPLTPSVVVQARDSLNALQTAYAGAVTVSIASGPTGALAGTPTVTAVAGAATFSTLRLMKKGAYTLSFSAPGLTSATTSSFVVDPAPAQVISVDSGNAQSALVSTALAQPFVVLVRDSIGNPVSGTAVAWAVTAGGGTLSGATATTDAGGRARALLTLGATPGTNTVQASSTGLTGSPVTFTATGTTGPAATLVITAPPAMSQAAGTSGGNMTVEVRDALSNVVTGFTGAVTLAIASGPAAATVIGPTSVNAAAGVATFGGVSFDKMGSYTLTFASTGLASATTAAFLVNAGPAKFIAVDAGDAQGGPAGQPLPLPLSARITDQYGNKVTGQAVTWSVATGGGSLANAMTLTDTSGRVKAQWTLGMTVGAQTVTVSDAGLTPNPLTFTATANAVAYNKVWTGAVSTDWATAGNWSPSGVPVATDSIRIDSVTNAPVLGASTTIARLSGAPGTSLTLASGTVNLTVNGRVDIGANGTIGGAGTLILGGTVGTIVGPSFPLVKVSGNYTLSGHTTFTGNVEVATGGTLSTNGFSATIAGNLTTAGTGTIAMSSGTDLFNVGGSVTLGGGNVALNTGELRIGGSFTQSGAGTFAQTGGLTQFTGTTSKTIAFTDTTASSYFAAITNGGSGSITLNSPVRAKGTYQALAGAGLISGIGKALRAGGVQLVDTTQFAVDTLDVWVPTTLALTSRVVTTLLVTANPVMLGNTVLLHGDAIIAGSGNLASNQRTLVANNLSTISSGQLTMTSALDTVDVKGNVLFSGGVTAGTLTAGGLSVGGHFTQSTNTQAFKAGPQHRTWLAGTGNQTITFAHPDTGLGAGCASSCFGQLRSSKTAGIVTINSDLKADSTMRLDGMDSVLAVNRSLQARGDFSANNRVDGTVRARFVRYAGTLYRTGGTFAVDTLVAYGSGPQLLQSESLPVILLGTATLPARMYGPVIVEGASGQLQTAGNDTVLALTTRNGGRLRMVSATDSLFVQKDALFTGGATTGLLTAGTLVVGGNLGISGPALDASGTHTTLMRSDTARTLAADPQSTSIGFQNLAFAGYGMKYVKFTASTAINVKGRLIARSGSGYVGSDSANSQLWMKAGGAVYDSTASGDVFRFARLYVSGVTALPKRLAVGDLMVSGGVQQLFDSLVTTSSVTVSGSSSRLDLNGHRLRLAGANKSFLTEIGGTLRMKHPADSLVADNGNGLYFIGGPTDTLLTDGIIVASGLFQAGGSGADLKAFSATANHVVRVVGTGVRRLKMQNASFANSHFGTLIHDITDTLYLKSDVVAESFATGAGASHPVRADTGIYALLAVKGASVNGAVFDRTRFQLDDGAAVSSLANVSFLNQDPTATQLGIKRSGSGTAGSLPALTGTWTFGTAPSTGLYMYALDTDSLTGGTLVNVNFSGTVTPAAHGGKVTLAGGATTSWPFGLSLTMAASGDWNTAATWSPAVVPTANDDVTIPAGASATLSAPAFARHITIAATGALDIGSQVLTLNGNLSAAGISIGGSSTGFTVAGTGTHTLAVSSLPGLSVNAGAIATLSGTTSITGDANLSGVLVPSGNYVYLSGTLTVNATGGLKMTNAADSVVVGNATFSGARSDTLLTDGKLVVTSNLTQSGNALAFAPTGNHVTYLTGGGSMPALRAGSLRAFTETAIPVRQGGRVVVGNQIQFANPGWASSRFNILRFNHTNDASLNFASDVYAVRAEAVGMTSMRTIAANAPRKFFIKGANLFQLSFSRVAMQVDAGGVLTSLDTLSFISQDSTADQLTLNLPASGGVTLRNFSFSTPPFTGRYLVASTSGAATVTMVNPTPGSHGSKVGIGSGVTLSGWPTSQAYTAVGGNWGTSASWSPAGVPSRHDNVTITGATIALTADAEVADLTLGAGGVLNLQTSAVHVNGNWSTDTTASVSSGASWAKSFHKGAGKTIQGKLGPVEISGTVSLGGWAIVNGELVVTGTGASLDVGSNTLTVTGAFSTSSSGVLKMGSGSSRMSVAGNATFNGAATTGLLTNGTLLLYQNLSAIDQGFDASGGHITDFTGTPGQNIGFTGGGTKGKFHHLRFHNSGVKTFDTDAWVGGDITIGSDVGNNIGGSGTVYWSGSAMRDSSSAGAAPNGRWAVGTTSLEGTVSTFPARVGSALTVAGALTLNDSLRVNNAMNVSGTLNLNGQRLQASSFETLGTGLVQMTNSGNADTLLVNGLASWHGGTPNITNGVTVFNGSFSQAPGSAANTNTFSPTGAHKTLFMRASLIDSTVTFTNPTASFFNNVELRANIALGSDVTLNGTLTRTAATPAAMVVAGSAAQVLTTAGIIGDGIYPINFSNARLKFVDGTSDATPRNLTFINFASGYAGIIFEVSRSTATVLNSVTFSGLSLSGGSYVKNTGSGTVTFSGSGTCTTTLTPGLSCP